MQLQQKFSGTIDRDINIKSGKTKKDTYIVSNLWELAEKLNLVTETDINIMKGYTQYTCGCWCWDKNPVKCPICRKILRDRTEAEIEEDKLWEC